MLSWGGVSEMSWSLHLLSLALNDSNICQTNLHPVFWKAASEKVLPVQREEQSWMSQSTTLEEHWIVGGFFLFKFSSLLQLIDTICEWFVYLNNCLLNGAVAEPGGKGSRTPLGWSENGNVPKSDCAELSVRKEYVKANCWTPWWWMAHPETSCLIATGKQAVSWSGWVFQHP